MEATYAGSVQASESGVRISPSYYFRLAPDELYARMHAYGLEAEDEGAVPAIAVSAVAHNAMAAHLVVPSARNACERFLVCLGEWRGWREISIWVERVIEAWLEAYAAGTPMQVATLAVQKVFSHQSPAPEHIQQLQLFLSGILAEAACGYESAMRRHVEYHEASSGLPNVRQMQESLKNAIETRGDGLVGLMLVGFENGIPLLRKYQAYKQYLTGQILNRIRESLRGGDMIYHLDTAEFGIVMSDLISPDQLTLVAGRLQGEFDKALRVDGRRYKLVPVMGAAYTSAFGCGPENLYFRSHLAQEEARHQGNPFELFRPELERTDINTMLLDGEIAQALEDNALELYFQPLVSQAPHRCVGAEVLLRWHRADGRPVPPPRIVDTLYRLGLGADLLRWLLNTACRLGNELNGDRPSPLYLSINLTDEELHDEELPEFVTQAVSLWGMSPANLNFEVTENSLRNDDATCLRILEELAALGCGLSLDNFGTGYSSMERLRRLPVNTVKIDQSFVRNLVRSRQDLEITRAIIMLAHGLGMEVIAEGVEDSDCLSQLESMRCDRYQGHLFSPALAFEDFCRWLRNNPQNIQPA